MVCAYASRIGIPISLVVRDDIDDFITTSVCVGSFRIHLNFRVFPAKTSFVSNSYTTPECHVIVRSPI